MRRLHSRPPLVDPFMDGCVWAREATDAMETSIHMHETCACMHITRNSCGYYIKMSVFTNMLITRAPRGPQT